MISDGIGQKSMSEIPWAARESFTFNFLRRLTGDLSGV